MLQTREASAAYSLAAGRACFPKQVSIHKKKNCNHSGNHSLKLFCIAFFIKFSNNELAVIDHPKCSNLQQPLYSLMFHCLLHTATPSSITNYHLVLQPKHLSCNVRLRGSKRHDKLEFWPQILRSYIDDKHSG